MPRGVVLMADRLCKWYAQLKQSWVGYNRCVALLSCMPALTRRCECQLAMGSGFTATAVHRMLRNTRAYHTRT